MWHEFRVGSILCWFNPVWVQFCGFKPMWVQSRVGLILCGFNLICSIPWVQFHGFNSVGAIPLGSILLGSIQCGFNPMVTGGSLPTKSFFLQIFWEGENFTTNFFFEFFRGWEPHNQIFFFHPHKKLKKKRPIN